jgi:hypothetical protein
MKRLSFLIIFAISAWLCTDCDTEESFSKVPYIEFRSFSFSDAPGNSIPDTIKLTIYFRDGDFNLGLETNESGPPYNSRNYYLKSGATTPTYNITNKYQYITYALKRELSIDTLPNYISPYNCTHWSIEHNQNGGIADTVLRKHNLNGLNIFVDSFTSTGSGFEKLELMGDPFCFIGLSGRFRRPFTNSTGGPFQFRKNFL